MNDNAKIIILFEMGNNFELNKFKGIRVGLQQVDFQRYMFLRHVLFSGLFRGETKEVSHDHVVEHFVFFVEENLDGNGDGVGAASPVGGEEWVGEDAGGVFFGAEDDGAVGHGGECGADAGDVFFGELMVVGEG